MPLHVSSTCAHHQEVKIALHSLWYHHTVYSDNDQIKDGRRTARHVHRYVEVTHEAGESPRPVDLPFVISSIAIAVARRSYSMILYVPHTINSTHVAPLKCVTVSSLHSQITTSDLTHTVTF